LADVADYNASVPTIDLVGRPANPTADPASGIASNIIKMVVNQNFSSGLEPGALLDYFPYLAQPPPTS
jgi:hypothetical protein